MLDVTSEINQGVTVLLEYIDILILMTGWTDRLVVWKIQVRSIQIKERLAEIVLNFGNTCAYGPLKFVTVLLEHVVRLECTPQ